MMVFTLFTISFFISLLLMTGSATELLKSKVDITAYFNETASKDQIFAVENALLSRSDVKTVDYISKEEALKRWQERNNDNENLKNIVSETYNPLPRSLEIKTENPEDLEAIDTFLSASDYQPLIKEISYRKNKDLVDRLVRITSFIKYIGWILSGVFVVVSILIIYNTIRLTIYARKDEIDIMNLVGASDWYIQGPFVLEGISYGILGAIVSSAILLAVSGLLVPIASNYLGIGTVSFNSAGNLAMIVSVELLTGIFLGVICSAFAVRKHLK